MHEKTRIINFTEGSNNSTGERQCLMVSC